MNNRSSMLMAAARSPETKREFQTVIDVLAADHVGRFRDEDLAEASLRVSGASISREFGGGERVSTPSTAPSLEHTSLDGHAIDSPMLPI